MNEVRTLGRNLLKPPISQVELRSTDGHDIINIWESGGLAGKLTVTKGKGMNIVSMFIDPKKAADLLFIVGK